MATGAEPLDDAVMRDRAAPLARLAGHAAAEVAAVGRPGPGRSSPSSGRREPSTTARYWRSMSCALNSAWKARTASGERASASAPEVSLSSRWTTPTKGRARRGGSTGSGPARSSSVSRSRSGVGSVSSPAGLSTIRTWRSSCRTRSRLATVRALGRLGKNAIGVVGLDLAAGLVAALAREVDPAVADRLARPRDRPNRSATSLSRRIGMPDAPHPVLPPRRQSPRTPIDQPRNVRRWSRPRPDP